MPWKIHLCDTWSPQPQCKYCTNCINMHLLKYVITYPWVTLCFQKPPNTDVSLAPSPLKTPWKCPFGISSDVIYPLMWYLPWRGISSDMVSPLTWYILWHGISSDITHSYFWNQFTSPHNSVYNNTNSVKPRRMFSYHSKFFPNPRHTTNNFNVSQVAGYN